MLGRPVMRDELRARLLTGRPCGLPGCAASADPSVSFARVLPPFIDGDEGGAVCRSVGLDVHRDFCEVAILDGQGGTRSGRVHSSPEDLKLFAQSLAPTDRVALEVTGNAWEIARIIKPHVAKVIVVSPSDTGIRQARAKTDRLDALVLARLLAAARWMRCGCAMNRSARCAVGWPDGRS